MRFPANPQHATPVLKWAGGKRALLSQYEAFFPAEFGDYHEPFVGGAAVFFHLQPRLGQRRAFLGDVNGELINFYQVLRDHVESLIELLGRHKSRHSDAYYYKVRQKAPRDPVQRAARLGYLNKTCFNGLYRVNSRGGFNVPVGRYRNPAILDEDRLRAASRALQGTDLQQEKFTAVLERARPRDLVYFDPPYHPLSLTSNFTSYTSDCFTEQDQRDLAEVFRQLHRKGVLVLLSNSDTPLIRELYRGFCLHPVQAPRCINSRADSRGAVQELLISGTPLPLATRSLRSPVAVGA
ncbi:MAG: DNA adenine methylase [Candidatus Eremiobacterota bacterium]